MKTKRYNSGISYLKVKIKSLAAEARFIKREQERSKTIRRRSKASTPSETEAGLREHRLNVVRPETRAALIAYAIIRGKSPAEAPDSRPFNTGRVEQLVRKFGRTSDAERLAEFLDQRLKQAA